MDLCDKYKKDRKGTFKEWYTRRSEIQKWLDLIIELATSKTGQHSLWLWPSVWHGQTAETDRKERRIRMSRWKRKWTRNASGDKVVFKSMSFNSFETALTAYRPFYYLCQSFILGWCGRNLGGAKLEWFHITSHGPLRIISCHLRNISLTYISAVFPVVSTVLTQLKQWQLKQVCHPLAINCSLPLFPSPLFPRDTSGVEVSRSAW